jgi:simple sugar transport system ATP-binding protein
VEPLIRMEKISKSFGPVRALCQVDLTLNRREILGLVGDNGAGKSTLMKVLTGVYQPDEGEIYFNGQRVRFNSPYDSRNAGIEMVYQDLALAGNLHIAGNIFLGRELTKKYLGGLIRFLDHKGMAREAARLLERLKIEIRSVDLKVETLSGGQRQAVAVGRSMGFNATVVVMDEPTAALAVREVAKVLDLVKSLKEHDVSVILISHRMQDVFEVSDRIMVLRQGGKVGDLARSQTTMDEVVALITGAQGGTLQAVMEVV